MVRLTLGYERSGMGRLADWLDEQERRMAMPPASARAVRQCLEEAVANLLDHTQADPGNAIVIELEWQRDTLVASVEDAGPPFDLRAAPVPVNPTTLETAVPGGWGIPLIRAFANEIGYGTNAGRNRLTLRFVPDTADRGGKNVPARPHVR